MNETLKVLKERRSIRKYKPEQITDGELNAILEAGTWAASAKNLQTPVMVVVQDKETIDRMSRLNAEIQGVTTDPFYGAPTVVVVLADGTKPNWLQDGSLVMGNLMTAARLWGSGPAGSTVQWSCSTGPRERTAEKMGSAGNSAGRWELRAGLH